MQQEENYRQDYQKEDRKQLLAEAGVKDRPAIDEIFAQDLNGLERPTGTEDDRHENGRLQRVKHQRIDVQVGDITENFGAERRFDSRRG